ncbi:MAG TPA: tRNA-dihydrouridine synthase family protein [Desulfobulbus sp.]|nr:tRNA-dihydrouridine synthase family protein [Desulfobulbus sp.]
MQVRHLEISPPLLLAPMAGLTHSALRTLLLSYGGVGLLSTEMLSARSLPVESEQASPFLVRTAGERPLSYQLLLTAEEEVEPAVEALHRFGADAVDLNLGCPAPRVRRAGGGSALMDEPGRVRNLIRRVRRATSLPLSAKIRLGEALDEDRLTGFCRMLQDEGIDLLTVHARLRGESFSRKPRWPWVARVKAALAIPVVANGGIFSVDDARRCLEQSGADGLMIGRAAARAPWLFARVAREVYGVDIPEPCVCPPLAFARFVTALQERFRPERRLGRLKEFTHYLAANYPFGHHLATAVQKARSVEDAWTAAMAFFRRCDQEGLARLEQEAGGIDLPAPRYPPLSQQGA